MSKLSSRRLVTVAGFLLIISLFVSCLIAYQLIRHKCFWWECAPNRNFSILDLNIPKDFFPPDAETHNLYPLRGDGTSIEAASTTNYWDDGVAIYIVRRFGTEAQAIRHYNFDIQIKFTRKLDENNTFSEILAYQSKNANNSRIQCGYVTNDFRCIYVARFEEFTVFFSGSIGENEMSKDDFLETITFIDGKVRSLLTTNTK